VENFDIKEGDFLTFDALRHAAQCVAISGNWKQLLASGKISDPIVVAKKRKRPFPNGDLDITDTTDSCETAKEIPVKGTTSSELTKALALDCEMVGVGEDGRKHALARVSIVNESGECIYDAFVKPSEKVTDYRTEVSGIRPKDIRNGKDLAAVRTEVEYMLTGRLLVGHQLDNDLKVLLLQIPRSCRRDTAEYQPLRRANGSKESLKNLAKLELALDIQTGEHSSVTDAYANMMLYKKVAKQWERTLQKQRAKIKPKKKPQLSNTHTVLRRVR